MGSIAYGSFPSQSKKKVFEDYPKPTSRQDFQLQCLGWASLDAPTPNKLLVGIVKLSLFGHKDNRSYLIRSGAAGPGVTRDW